MDMDMKSSGWWGFFGQGDGELYVKENKRYCDEMCWDTIFKQQ